MYSVEKLYRPASLPEALGLLSSNPEVTPLAGGTDVLVKMRAKRTRCANLMSLAGLRELRGITRLPNGDIAIGALETFTRISESELIASSVPLLKTAALAMGGPQVQNVATVGGNICNGATSADSAPPLFALDALLELHSVKGTRTVPIIEFYMGPGRVKKDTDELLVRILLPIGRRSSLGGAYIKMSTRKAMDIAVLGCAAVCGLDGNGAVASAAIALGVAAPTPVRCCEAEKLLVGQRLNEDILERAGEAALLAASPRSSWRASAEYREALVRELSARAFRQAFEAAGGRIS